MYSLKKNNFKKVASYFTFAHAKLGRRRVLLVADGRGFDPHFRQYSFVETGHEIISTAILSLPLIQEVQLSVTGERMCTEYW